jgi:hypothetical protein
VGPDVVGAPAATEILAAGRQFADLADQVICRSRSCGFWPAAVRRLATDMSAAKSQSGKNRRAAASRKVKRAKLGGRVGSAQRARPSWLAASTSERSNESGGRRGRVPTSAPLPGSLIVGGQPHWQACSWCG